MVQSPPLSMLLHWLYAANAAIDVAAAAPATVL
jgi:hypothetical protein